MNQIKKDVTKKPYFTKKPHCYWVALPSGGKECCLAAFVGGGGGYYWVYNTISLLFCVCLSFVVIGNIYLILGMFYVVPRPAILILDFDCVGEKIKHAV